jgi:uncharacterized membrane protein YczE
VTTIDVSPVSIRIKPARRFVQLILGLALYGFSMAMLVRAELGINPWSVLYEGLARYLPLSFGTITAILGVLVLLAWIPLKQRPGIGTVANILVLALSVDAGLALIPRDLNLPISVGLLSAGVVLNGLAVAVYVGARLGPGPRDGLMTGLAARTGRSVRLVRTAIELTVLAIGWVLGGTVGVGTLVYAFGVGPVTQFFLPRLVVRIPSVSEQQTSSVSPRDRGGSSRCSGDSCDKDAVRPASVSVGVDRWMYLEDTCLQCRGRTRGLRGGAYRGHDRRRKRREQSTTGRNALPWVA